MNLERILRIGILLVAIGLGGLVLLFFIEQQLFITAYSSLKSNLPAFLVSQPKQEPSQSAERARELQLLAEEERAKLQESFFLRESGLAAKEAMLLVLEQELQTERTNLITEREELLKIRERADTLAAEAASYDKKIQELAERFYNMPPQAAAPRIVALEDDILIIDVLAAMDLVAAENDQLSIVPFLLSLMPAEVSARIMKKATVEL